MKGPLGGLLAFICLVGAAFCFYKFSTWPTAANAGSGTIYVVIGIVLAILMVLFGVMFMSGRVNKTEDIHITE